MKKMYNLAFSSTLHSSCRHIAAFDTSRHTSEKKGAILRNLISPLDSSSHRWGKYINFYSSHKNGFSLPSRSAAALQALIRGDFKGRKRAFQSSEREVSTLRHASLCVILLPSHLFLSLFSLIILFKKALVDPLIITRPPLNKKENSTNHHEH